MTSKVHIRIGDVELSYETDAVLSIETVKDLAAYLGSVGSLAPKAPTPLRKNGSAIDPPVSQLGQPRHLNTIASLLSVTSGPKLAVAAAARLQVEQGKDGFSRSELLEEMKSAKQYFNSNMRKNLTNIFNQLVKNGSFNQVGDNSFSLAANVLHSVREKLVKP